MNLKFPSKCFSYLKFFSPFTLDASVMTSLIPDEKRALPGNSSEEVKPGIFAAQAGQDLPPLSLHVSVAASQKEVTIRQVAPLILLLSGAAFINVNSTGFLLS